ncbi:MAG: hypothetical protein J0H83_18850 [Candidatus Melainabacteria bacterium]|nr:hypothetical protein [Candidatus Melainabacteria bacterium]
MPESEAVYNTLAPHPLHAKNLLADSFQNYFAHDAREILDHENKKSSRAYYSLSQYKQKKDFRSADSLY